MRGRVRALVVTTIAALACDTPIEPDPFGRVAVSVRVSAEDLARSAVDAAQVRYFKTSDGGPGLTRAMSIVNDTAGASLSGLDPGTYTVAVEGTNGGALELFGQHTAVSVSAGNTAEALIDGRLFTPMLGGLSISTYRLSANVTFSIAQASDASGYDMQLSRNRNDFTGAPTHPSTRADTTISVTDVGWHFVRARARSIYNMAGVWSPVDSFEVMSDTVGNTSLSSDDLGFAPQQMRVQNLNVAPSTDVDWFRVLACRQDTVRVETFAARLNPPSGLNTRLELFSPGPTAITTNDDEGSSTDSRITHVLPQDDTLFLRVSSEDGSVGHYELEVHVGMAGFNTGSGCTQPPPSGVAVNAGDGQTAPITTAVPVAPSVLVTGAGSVPVSGVEVVFRATGDGAVTGTPDTTDGSGIATAGSWILGSTAATDSDTLWAVVTGVDSAMFVATATAGGPATVTVEAGDGQSAVVSTSVATAPSVLVADADANPVAGVEVVFRSSGDGAVTGSPDTTDASGIAKVGSWTLGSTAATDSDTLWAVVAGVDSARFVATATSGVGPPDTVVVNAGDGQTAPVTTAVAVAPSFVVRDSAGVPVQSVEVTFRATGDGSVAGSPDTTDTNGLVTVTSWTLGSTAGTDSDTLWAVVAGVDSARVIATATPGPPTTVSVQAGNGQSAAVSTAVPIAPSAIVRDASNNPVPDVEVTFRATGDGAVTGTPDTTDAGGIAAVGSWTLGNTVATDSDTLWAVVAGVDSAMFVATATGVGMGTPATLTLSPNGPLVDVSGPSQLLTPTVRDSAGNVITSPPTVTFTSLNPAVVTVDAGGNVTGVSAGQAIVEAVSDTARGYAVINVSDNNAPPVNLWTLQHEHGTTLHEVFGFDTLSIRAGAAAGGILEYDGTSWTQTATVSAQELLGIWGSSATQLFTANSPGPASIYEFDGTTWDAGTPVGGGLVLGFWGASPGDVWGAGCGGALGGECGASSEFMAHFDGAAWTFGATGVGGDWRTVWGTAADSVWAGGWNGQIMVNSGSGWALETTPTTSWVHAIWGLQPGDLWAVGRNGAVMRRIAGTWTSQAVGIGHGNDVWGTSSNDVYIVGSGSHLGTARDSGVVARFDGTTWHVDTLGYDMSGQHLWGNSEGVWAAAGNFTAVRGGILRGYRNASITASAASTTLNLGDTVTVTASALDASAVAITDSITYRFVSTDTARATVDSTGLVTAVGTGSVDVVVSVPGGAADTMSLTVAAATADTVTITANGPTTLTSIGATVDLDASAVDAMGNPVTGVAFVWTSLIPAFATVDTSGLVTAGSAGVVDIIAEAPGGAADTITITIIDNLGLQGDWRFDEGTGQSAGDSSGLDLHATLGATSGAESSDPAWIQGIVGVNALSFDGTDDFVQVPGDPVLEPANVSVEMWVRSTTSPPNGTYLLAKDPVTNLHASYAVADCVGIAGEVCFFVYDGSANVGVGNTSGTVWDGSWHHLVGTYDGSLVRFYIDSVIVDSVAVSGISYGAADDRLIIGAQDDGNWFFTGEIDGVKIWNRALSQADVAASFTTRNQLGVTTEPTDIAAGDSIAPAVVVEFRDENGSVVTSFTDQVTASITGGTGTAGATLLGTTQVNAVNGVATFGGLTIDSVGTAYRLDFTSGVFAVTSATFDVTAGAAARVSVSPTSAQLTVGGQQQLTVQARDQFDNVIPSPVVTWSAKSPQLASVNATGLVTALDAQQATVEARVDGVSGFSLITVINPTSTPVNLWSPETNSAVGNLNGVFGRGNVRYAVGQANNQRFDGTQWNAESPNTAQTMYDAWGSQSDDIWAVGNGVFMHRITTWFGDFVTGGPRGYDVWGVSRDDAFAVGSDGYIVRYDGTDWNTMTSGTTDTLRGVWGTGPDDVFAVGHNGTVMHWDGTNWSAQTSNTGERLYDVWGTGPNWVFAVGSNGEIIHYNGSAWVVQLSNTSDTLTRVWGSGPNDVYASATTGSVKRWDGTAWTSMNTGTTQPLYGIWGTSNLWVTVVGDNGTILRGTRGATVTIAPDPATLTGAPGDTVQLTATAVDSAMNPVPNVVFTWTSLDTTVATVDSVTGIVSAVATGSVSIVATAPGGVADTSVVDVTVAGQGSYASVSVTPGGPLVDVTGPGTTLTAAVLDSAGNAFVSPPPVAWTSLNPNVFTVDASGLVTGVSAGQAIVQAQSDTALGWAVVNVSDVGAAPVNLWALAFSHPNYFTWGDIWGSSSNDVWLATDPDGLFRYNGSTWTTPAQPPMTQVHFLWGLSGSDLFATWANSAGTNFARYQAPSWDGGSFLPVSPTALWGASPRDVWGNIGYPNTTNLAHFDGSSWSFSPSGTGALGFGAWGTSADSVWMTNQFGFKYYDGSVWTQYNTGEDMRGVWGLKPDDMWIVGINGGVYRGGVGGWTNPNPGAVVLTDVWGTSASDVYLTDGGQDVIWRFDGSAWDRDSLGYGIPPQRIWGNSEGVWIQTGAQATGGGALRGYRGASVTATVAADTLTGIGDTVTVQVTALDASMATITDSIAYRFTSFDNSIATVDAAGVVTAQDLGTVDVLALAPGGAADTVTFTVTVPAVAAEWRFDELTGQTAGDSSGNGLDAGLGTDPAVADALDPTWVDGAPVGPGALFFDSSMVRVVHDSLLEPANVTVEFWARSSDVSNFGVPLRKSQVGPAGTAYGFRTQNELEFFITDAGGSNVFSPSAQGNGVTVWDGEWHHIVGMYDGSALRLYVDGVEVGTGTAFSGSIGYSLYTDKRLVIGAFSDTFRPFRGEIDHVRILSGPPSPAEIAARAAQRNTLAVTAQPTDVTAGQAISPAVTVMLRDSLGNAITGFAGPITVSITPGTGTANANLSGTLTVNATNGFASFTDLSIDSAGIAYTLDFHTAAGVSVTSNAFNVNPGSAATVTLTPVSAQLVGVGASQAFSVTAVDALGNTIPSPTVTWSSEMPSVATMGSGLATAVETGQTAVSATVDGVIDYSLVSVTVPNATPVNVWVDMSVATTDRFRAIWGESETNVFAVGQSGRVQRYNGTSWSGGPGAIGASTEQVTLWGSSGSNVHTGNSGAGWYRFDGTQWNDLMPPVGQPFRETWGSSPIDVYMVGLNGQIRHWDGTNITTLTTPFTDSLEGAWGLAEDDIWAVGRFGQMRRWDGAAWQAVTSGTSESINAVWAPHPDTAYAVGSAGTILRFAGGTWGAQMSPTSENLGGVWGSSSDDIYAVAANGTVVRYDGATWSNYASLTTETIHAVWGTAAGDVFVVGGNGTIFRGERGGSAVVTPDPPATLTAIGDTVHLTATALDAGANPLSGVALTWASLDAGVATVDASGVVTAVAEGTADIVATAAGGAADTVTAVVMLPATVDTVEAFDDASIILGEPNTNFGSNGDGVLGQNIVVGENVGQDWSTISSAGDDISGLIRWQLTSIPSGSTVDSAFIRLRFSQRTNSGEIAVRYNIASWTEGTVTWATRPNTSYNVATFISDSCATCFIDVTSEVQGWVNDPATNFGVTLIKNSGTNWYTGFFTRQEGTAAFRPVLIVYYR